MENLCTLKILAKNSKDVRSGFIDNAIGWIAQNQISTGPRARLNEIRKRFRSFTLYGKQRSESTGSIEASARDRRVIVKTEGFQDMVKSRVLIVRVGRIRINNADLGVLTS